MFNIFFPTSNGVSVFCDEKQVVSITDGKGQKRLKSFKTRNKIIFWHFPFVRGLQYFFCGILAFFQSFMYGFDLSGEVAKAKDINKFYIKKVITIAVFVILGIVFAEVFLGLVPNILGYLIVDYRGSLGLRNFVITLLKVAIFALIMFALRSLPGILDLFRFNKVCDFKASESGLSKRKKGTRFWWLKVWWTGDVGVSNFCNFLIFVYLCNIIVVTLIGAGFGIGFNLLFHISIFLLSIMICYEIMTVVENVKALSWLRWITLCLVTTKPTRTHYETVSVALTEMNVLQKGREFMEDENKRALSVVLSQVRNKLEVAGIDEKSDAEWLIATVLGKNRAEMKLVPFVTEKQYQDIMKATERRANGESLDNIFGFTEFYGLRFDVNKKVLTPRMETEILVEQVLKAVKIFKNCTILDLGTGSGTIAVAVAKNCDAKVTAVDVSKTALAVAEQNAKKNGVDVEFLHSNLFQDLKRKRKFDIIVSNPPYIPTAQIPKLDKNVRECDPTLALDGGEDGLDFYREIIPKARKRLNTNGMIFFEVGKGQAVEVRKLLRENGFEEIKTTKDYNKIERIVSGRFK